MLQSCTSCADVHNTVAHAYYWLNNGSVKVEFFKENEVRQLSGNREIPIQGAKRSGENVKSRTKFPRCGSPDGWAVVVTFTACDDVSVSRFSQPARSARSSVRLRFPELRS